MRDNPKDIRCSTLEMTKYGLGACTESLVLNSLFGFSMLYYTKALGLAPQSAGLVIFIATMWNAIMDPIVGHVSDNTKSRLGKRYPYMMLGGVIMIVGFLFVWYLPAFVNRGIIIGSTAISAAAVLFCYLLVMNLIVRTGYAMFVIPYTALGFEICSDYEGRSKLQGIRNALNMAANILGPALAWTLFFNNNGQVQDTQVAGNYVEMGFSFTILAFVFLVLTLLFTAKYVENSRDSQTCRGHLISFSKNLQAILSDRCARLVLFFMFFALLGTMLVSTLQIYVFDDFMTMTGFQKTVAHGSTMAAMGLGSLSLAAFVRRFEKKGAVLVAVAAGAFCELLLALLFLTGLLSTDPGSGGFSIPFLVFIILHGAYWFGNGILVPTAISMMADVSELNIIKTGINKDASYAAAFSLVTKISMGIGGLMAGYCLTWTGFHAGFNAVQTAKSVWRIGALTFVVGPLISMAGLLLIRKYPVNRVFIEACRSKSALDRQEMPDGVEGLVDGDNE